MLSFRARLFLAFALLWLLFLGGGWYLAGRSVDQALKRRLEATLAQDALRAAEAYQKGQAGALLTTGGVYLHLYAQDGTPIALTRPDHRLPPERLRRAGPTPEVLWEEGFAAALVATPLGLLVLTAETSPIEAALEALREALLRAFLLLSPLGLALVYLTARLAARPLEAVAREITRRSPDRLDPVPHRLPQDEFGRMVEAVNALLQALKEAKERERAFLAEASHELRTPLTVLLGHLDRLGRNPQDLEALRTARATAERMRRLVEDLLALARGEVERNLNLHIVDLGEVAREAALEHGVAAEAESAEVLGDPDRLLQLLRNLVANAVRAAGKEGVRVRVRREADHALLEVEDSGPGIPEDLLPRLFQRFARGPGGGTGLGLAIAHAIAKAHGGEIAVESRPGRTVFRVRLPLLEEEA
ncbi:sensor histidine kinase [Thermus thermophilus]|uniref:histidine kinase n=1 Tax=Thermus thermophilus (strain ATCC BAA-163 / DSM 7039 / HB27) TaxID=262724 RepID=Q72IY3_THET2|nr:HAMP domain-containing sensor histidine kinase [Thermus thermophilus]AAS81340.1 sensory transduction histidine kinase [Thermus thermophilus HB27]WMV94458.1 HAMP domain-containing sensor histidine kinase [Thermus thermophilus HB27]